MLFWRGALSDGQKNETPSPLARSRVLFQRSHPRPRPAPAFRKTPPSLPPSSMKSSFLRSFSIKWCQLKTGDRANVRDSAVSESQGNDDWQFTSRAPSRTLSAFLSFLFPAACRFLTPQKQKLLFFLRSLFRHLTVKLCFWKSRLG